MRSPEDYREALAALLPTGHAWPRDPETTLMLFLYGQSKVWSDVDGRLDLLLRVETDPRYTYEMLDQWERAWGLPDECVSVPGTLADRRIALVEKMMELGGQSRAYFIGLAARLGYTITITEFRPWMVGYDEVGGELEYPLGHTLVTDSGDTLVTDTGDNLQTGPMGEMVPGQVEMGPETIRFYWVVNVGSTRLTWFRTGGDGGELGVDHHLEIAIAEDLECLIKRYKPAHTEVLFNYSGLETPDPMAGLP